MAMFKNARHAIAFAYRLQSYEPSPQSGYMQTIRRMMGNDSWGRECSDINFDGLNSIEIRAQCAMILSAIKRICTARQRAAIEAFYGVNVQAEDGRFVFSNERKSAIKTLADSLDIDHAVPAVVFYGLIAKAVDQDAVSIGRLSSCFEIPRSTLYDLHGQVVVAARQIESGAVRRVDEYLKGAELID